MEVKYIYYEGFDNCMHIVVFDCITSHNDMANSLRIPREKIHSAGFISFSTNASNNQGAGFSPSVRAVVYGESITLEVKSNKDHEKMINKLLGMDN